MNSNQSITAAMNKQFYAMNRQAKTVCLLPFQSSEETRSAAAWGILMPDGKTADAWGSCAAGELPARAAKSGFILIEDKGYAARITPVSGTFKAWNEV